MRVWLRESRNEATRALNLLRFFFFDISTFLRRAINVRPPEKLYFHDFAKEEKRPARDLRARERSDEKEAGLSRRRQDKESARARRGSETETQREVRLAI